MVAVVEVETVDRNPHIEIAPVDRGVRDGWCRDRCDVHDCFLGADRARATMLSASTAMVMISAPVQASVCQSL